jgi:hypothetical protein
MKWCRELSEGRTDVHDEQRRVRPSLISDEAGQAAHFYDSGIQKLVPRLNKYLDNAGDYVEK